MKALVLAAGYATRLYPLTLDRPKALLEVGGRPMLDHVLERLDVMGVDETIVVTNAKFTPHFEEWATESGVRVVNDGTTSNDDRLGAIGDIGFVLDEHGVDDDLVVVAGDNLFGDDVSGFSAYGRGGRRPRARGTRRRRPRRMREYNQVDVDDEGPRDLLRGEAGGCTVDARRGRALLLPGRTLPLIRQYLAKNNPDQPGRLPEWLYSRTSVYTWRPPASGTTSARRDACGKPIASFRRVVPSCHRHCPACWAPLTGTLRRVRSIRRRALRLCRYAFVRLEPSASGAARPGRGRSAAVRSARAVGSRSRAPVRRSCTTSEPAARPRMEGARAAPARGGGGSDGRGGRRAAGRRPVVATCRVIRSARGSAATSVLAARRGSRRDLGAAGDDLLRRARTSRASAVSRSQSGDATSAAGSSRAARRRAQCASSTTCTPRARPRTPARRHSARRARRGRGGDAREGGSLGGRNRLARGKALARWGGGLRALPSGGTLESAVDPGGHCGSNARRSALRRAS